MAPVPALIGPNGQPLAPSGRRPGSGMRGSFGGSSGSAPSAFPYEAANWSTPEMSDWFPWIRSPDSEINLYRDRMVARQRDLVRNDGWASGVVDRILDSTVGVNFRLIANPDYRRLQLDNALFDEVWFAEFRRAAEAYWRNYAVDLGRYNDVERQQTVSQQFRVALRHELVDGESLMLRYWLPDRIGLGAAQYASATLLVDPDRLSNPFQQVDTATMRAGVEIDRLGVPIAAHVRKAHQNDWYNAVESQEWDRIAWEDSDGFRRVVHGFKRDRASQHRGVSVFAPILSRMKMLAEYYGVELQAARVASVFGTFITSPFDRDMVEEALSGAEELNAYQDLRADFHERKNLMMNRVRIPTLVPGEDIKSVSSAHPHGDFSPFTHEMLRSVAAALGVSAEQVTQDYSETNYSSARAAIVEAEKTFKRRTADFEVNTATPIYAGWLHEAMDLGEMPMPKRGYVPSYLEARNAYARCKWLGPARGWVDPVAERQGAVLGMDAGFDTLENVCADQGEDWEENIAQRRREKEAFEEAGLPLPQWMGPMMNANQVSQKPTKPEPV